MLPCFSIPHFQFNCVILLLCVCFLHAYALDMRMRQTILLEKMTIKKFLSHFALIEDSVSSLVYEFCFLFYLWDSLLILFIHHWYIYFSTQFGINSISYQFRKFLFYSYCLSIDIKNILQNRSWLRMNGRKKVQIHF